MYSISVVLNLPRFSGDIKMFYNRSGKRCKLCLICLTCIDFLDLFTPTENEIKDFDKLFGFFRESVYSMFEFHSHLIKSTQRSRFLLSLI